MPQYHLEWPYCATRSAPERTDGTRVSLETSSPKIGAAMSGTDRVKINLEEIKVKGNQLVDKVKEVIEEGNARRVSIRKDERILLEFPLTVGVGGATAAIFFTPVLAAVGALAALVSDVDVIIEREHTDVDVEEETETVDSTDSE